MLSVRDIRESHLLLVLERHAGRNEHALRGKGPLPRVLTVGGQDREPWMQPGR